MTEAFYWIGVAVSALAILAIVGVALLLFWGRLIHGRFHAILFRKGQRRLSVAAWHGSRLVSKQADDGLYDFDDWPVNERPLYLSYRLGQKRRLFFLAGMMTGRRSSVGKGRHPEESK